MNAKNVPNLSLIADIGGTNIRLALQHADGSQSDEHILTCGDFKHINDAIKAYYDLLPGKARPTAAGLAVAAAPSDVYVEFPNSDWTFYVRDVKDTFKFDDVKVINDFTAIALAVPHFTPDDYTQIGGDAPKEGAPYNVIGPGTGLGVSTVVPAVDPAFIILTNNEGGHFTLPAMTTRESLVLNKMRAHYNHISAERVLSGPGLLNLYNALCELDDKDKIYDQPRQVTEMGLSGTDARCHEALELFCAFLGTAASNLCISTAAYGGVYLGGGIINRLGAFFEESKFRKRFDTKGRFSGYLEPVPVFQITHELPAMLGLRTLMLDMAPCEIPAEPHPKSR